MWVLIGLTLLWVFVLAQIIVHFRSLEITGSWDQHRCDPSVMFTAAMYNTDPTRSGAAFAAENFTFCTRRLASSVLATVFSPVTGVLDGLLDGADKGIQSMGTVSSIAQRLFNGLQAMLDTVFNRYQNTYLEMRRTLMRLMTAMSRLHAAGIATVYMGIAMIQGFFSAYEFVKKVVMIILGILLALLFLLFFALLPTIPLILAVIVAVGAGGGMASEFCFAPDTPVILANGTTASISTITPGQRLHGGATAEAVLELDGTSVDLWNYKGVRVSGSHIVRDANKWKCVRDCGKALGTRVPKLWCLITSDRRIHVAGSDGPLCFLDYEEIQGEEMYNWWNQAVHAALGAAVPVAVPQAATVVQEGLHPSVLVEVWGGRLQSVDTLRIGDVVKDGIRWTTVVGTVRWQTTDKKWIKWGKNLIGAEQFVHTGQWQRCGLGNGITEPQAVAAPIGLFTESRTFSTADGSHFRDASEHDGSIDSIYTEYLLQTLNV